jgi:hypothetical protein
LNPAENGKNNSVGMISSMLYLNNALFSPIKSMDARHVVKKKKKLKADI